MCFSNKQSHLLIKKSTDHALYKLLAIPANISSLMHQLIKSFKSNYSGVISDGHKHCLHTDCILQNHFPRLLLRILQYTSIFQTPHPWGQSSRAKAEQIPTYPHPFPIGGGGGGVVGLNIDRRITIVMPKSDCNCTIISIKQNINYFS